MLITTSSFTLFEKRPIAVTVMVSTTIQGNFTTNARLVREQRRAQSKESLMAIINSTTLSEEQKQSAVETLVNLTTIAEKENAAELLLEAKGFADPIVNISENEVDVVINTINFGIIGKCHRRNKQRHN